MSTLADLRRRVRQKCQAENDLDWLDNEELDQYINDSRKELYGILVRYGLIRVEATQEIIANGAASYPVNNDYFATLDVWREHSQHYFRLNRFSHRRRPFAAPQAITGDATRYRIADTADCGKQIELLPRPGSGTYLHTYVPIPDLLVQTTDSVDDILGWDEYIVLDASIKVKDKENDDAGPLVIAKQAIRARIEAEKEAEEMSESWVVQPTRRFRRGRGDFGDPANYWWAVPGDTGDIW